MFDTSTRTFNIIPYTQTKKRTTNDCLRNLVTLLVSSTIVSACANLDHNNTWTNVFFLNSPVVRTYDDCMLAANDSVKAGDSEAALTMYRKAVETAKSEYGPNDLRVATSATYLASYCVSLGLMGEAETYYKKALAVYSSCLGPDNPETISVKKALADVLMKLYKLDEANKLLHEAKLSTDKVSKKH